MKNFIKLGSENEEKINNLLQSEDKFEIEASIGSFKPEKIFIPGLFSVLEFENLKKYFDKIGNSKISKTILEIMDVEEEIINRFTGEKEKKVYKIRRILDVETGGIAYERKFRDYNAGYDNFVWGFRISKSEEKFFDYDDSKFKPNITRIRNRYSYTLKKYPNFQIDLSIIEEIKLNSKSANLKYEVEIERLKGSKKLNWTNLIEPIEEIIVVCQNISEESGPPLSLISRNKIIKYFNSFFVRDIRRNFNNPYRMFSYFWNKPKNIKVKDILYTENLAPTVKVDGFRKFALFSKEGVYFALPPDSIYPIGYPTKKNDFLTEKYAGSLLDGEFLEENNTYYIFDILFENGKDVRYDNFYYRYSLLEKYNDLKVGKIKFEIKKFYFEGTFYEKTRKVYEDVNLFEQKGIALDGLIFQPTKLAYRNESTYKWKPEELLTIDFLCNKENDDEYGLFVSRGRDNVQFVVSYPEKFDGKVKIQDGVFENTPINGKVVEMGWNKEEKTFQPKKIRFDRLRPNEENVARDIWEDIIKPIDIKTILGYSLRVMRAYHNEQKEMLIRDFTRHGEIMLDIGSGRGGDLIKWEKHKLSKVYAVEPSEENLQTFNLRLNSLENYATKIKIMKEGAENTSTIISNIEEESKKVDIIAAFFSLTYFMENEDKYKSLLSTIFETLRIGGRFIGIVMDGKRVRKTFSNIRKLKKLDENDEAEWEEEAYTIIAPKAFSKDDFGNELFFTISDEDSMIKNQKEWLFNFKKFKTDLEALGINIIAEGYLDNGFPFSNLDQQSQKLSSLFVSFVFEKKGKKYYELINVIQPVDKALKLPTIYGNENLYLVGVITGSSNIFHAIAKALNDDYDDMSEGQRRNFVEKFRIVISRNITMKDFLSIDGGNFAKKYRDYYVPKVKNNNLEYALEVAWLNFILTVRNVDKWVDDAFIISIISRMLKCNIYVFENNLIVSSRFKFACNSNYNNSIVLITNGTEFSIISVEKDKYLRFLFSSNSKFIKSIRRQICV